MPWSIKTAPKDPQRYSGDHQKKRREWATVIKAYGAYCQQGIPGNGSSGTCIMSSRFIPPTTPSNQWALGHNDAGTETIGPTHRRCNARDGARRGALVANANRKAQRRGQHQQRW